MGSHTVPVHTFQPLYSVATITLPCSDTSAICSDMKNVMWRMRISTEEMAQWTERATAEGKTVSQLVREVMAGYLVYVGGERRPAGAASRGSSERATPPPPKTVVVRLPDQCIHGEDKGYHCWQCGGRAVVK